MKAPYALKTSILARNRGNLARNALAPAKQRKQLFTSRRSFPLTKSGSFPDASLWGAAFTILELLCVIAIIGILAAILLPAVNQAKARAQRVACVEQLHQAGIAFTGFAHEHDGKFPMAVPALSGGSLEFAQPAAYGISDSTSFHHFQTLADELHTPRMVLCPADTRLPATNFVALRNENVSYFIGLNAQLAKPDSILAGDRSITNDYISAPCCILRLDPGGAIRWTRELHVCKGNLLFADGRVEESNKPRLTDAGSRVASMDLMLPTVGHSKRPEGPSLVLAPPLPASIARFAPPKTELSTSKPLVATTPLTVRYSTVISNQPDPALLAALEIADISSNPSAWLLPQKQAPDPGFSLFPKSVTLLPEALVRKSVWPLWLLLLLILAGLLGQSRWLGR